MITIELPSPLAVLAGRARVETEAENVEAALRSLEAIQPGMSRKVLDDRGILRPHILVFVNGTEVRELEGLRTPLYQGQTVLIVPAVSGG